MNLTLSADDDVVEAARRAAARQGTSLNELVCGYLRSLAGHAAGATAGAESIALMREHGGHSGGQPIRRQDAYGGRLP